VHDKIPVRNAADKRPRMEVAAGAARLSGHCQVAASMSYGG